MDQNHNYHNDEEEDITGVDMESAHAARTENEPTELQRKLPKLAARIHTPPGKSSSAGRFGETDVSPDPGSRAQRPARHGVRLSVRGNVVLPPAVKLSVEAEALRTQDINPDVDSAAEKALRAAAGEADADAAAESSGGGSGGDRRASMRRRRSSLRMKEGVPGAKGTGRRVEGREIQQDHAQYALTYGMMLGIRVMTGRRDILIDAELRRTNSQSSSGSSPAKPTKTKLKIKSKSGKTKGAHVGTDVGDEGEGEGFSAAAARMKSNSDLARSMMSERELTQEDYDAELELTFDPAGSSGPPLPTPPHKLHFAFKFKDYMWNVFRAVRALSGIDEADYMLSLAGDFNYIEFIANSKSGQFFFYSHDGQYMIKTQSKEESQLLRQIMPSYVQHLTEHPDSLLVRFYGMHRVKFGSQRIYFVIMSSVFYTEKPIEVKFDLKGSTQGRLTPLEQCRQGAVQKDINLMSSGRKICLGEEHVEVFHQTLRADVYFLRDLNIMDYSLLLGVHNKRARPQMNRRRSTGVVLAHHQAAAAMAMHGTGAGAGAGDSHGGGGGYEDAKQGQHESEGASGNNSLSLFQSCHGGLESAADAHEIYFMGIIDILQLYNAGKKAESFYKGMFTDKSTLSAVNPTLYAERMLEFIMRHTDYEEVLRARAAARAASVGAAGWRMAANSSAAKDSPLKLKRRVANRKELL